MKKPTVKAVKVTTKPKTMPMKGAMPMMAKYTARKKKA